MKIAVLGYGTVGSHVCSILEKTDIGITVKAVLRRPGVYDSPLMTSDYDAILSDPEITAIVDALPAVQPSYEYMKKALLAGKHVVTANKAALCEGLADLMQTASNSRMKLLYEAACGGALPIIEETAALSAIDEISDISGILNGTCNYILDEMEKTGTSFSEALANAQALGYAEADPTADLSGYDVRNKAALLTATAYRALVTKDFPVAGIELFSDRLLNRFLSEKKRVRLMMLAARRADAYAIGVVPVLLPFTALEANVPSNFNIASIKGSFAGELKFYGQGAGGYPTADAVVRDLLKIERGSFADTDCFQNKLRYDESLLTGFGCFETGERLHGTLSALIKKAKAENTFLAFEPDASK